MYLLSLPENLVSCFHELTGLSRSEYFCTSDPAGSHVGSGAGTAWLLEQCCRAQGGTDLRSWLPRERRILLHAGGQSRRLPAYATVGKVLTPVPVFRWARGQQTDQTLLSLQLPLYRRIMERAPQGQGTLVASGDVCLRTTQDIGPVPQADVVCYGLWAETELASHHGMFVMSRQESDRLDFMLQKPTPEQQSALLPTHFMLMDIGVWLLSDRAVERLCQRSHQADGSLRFYDLYSDFGQALGQHPSKPDPLLADLTVAIVPLRGGEFYHFGTSPELLGSTMALQNLVKDQRQILQRGVKRQPTVITQNAQVPPAAVQGAEWVWIENSVVPEGWRFAGHNILTGLPRLHEAGREGSTQEPCAARLTLPEGVCLDIVPVGQSAWCVRLYGYDDAFRGATDAPSTRYLGRPLAEWRATYARLFGRELPPCDLQDAPLFPLCHSLAELAETVEALVEATHPAPQGEGHPASCTLRPASALLSATELTARANLPRLQRQREALALTCLQEMARNWRRSIFYQTDLRTVASTYARHALPLPEALPADAPLMTRIHDAMFRAEVLKRAGAAAAEQAGGQGPDFADQAFRLLREGLTEGVLRTRQRPRLTTCQDQIVWGRSPVRIDVAGGWTDTPPYSLLSGGGVVNLAIDLGGQQPLQVYVRPSREPVITCRSIDLGASERIETYEQLQDWQHVGSPFSIPKAALALAGFAPRFCAEQFASLRQQLEAMGAGLELTLLSAIPAGSGLGTSSILASTVLGALSDFCGLAWDKNQVAGRTLVLEQLLTTGGGWQDQYGGVLPGVKLLRTGLGFDQSPTVDWLPERLFTSADTQPCHLLYYTGLTRTAKGILAEIVRGMFLNSSTHLSLLSDMKLHALAMAEAIQRADLARYGALLRETWRQNRALDAGTCPPAVEALCKRIDPYCLGYKLPGAGGGGYMYMLAKDPEAALRLRRELSERPLTPNARFVEMTISQTGLQVSRS